MVAVLTENRGESLALQRREDVKPLSRLVSDLADTVRPKASQFPFEPHVHMVHGDLFMSVVNEASTTQSRLIEDNKVDRIQGWLRNANQWLRS